MHKVWTYADLKHTPDDGKRYEIFDGELVVTPAPRPPHQFAVWELTWRFYHRLKTVAVPVMSPVDVILTSRRVLIPDVVVVRHERRAIISNRGIEGPPDLVVEVLSPRGATRDRVRKARLYAQSEIPEYWIADPVAKTIEVYALGDRGYCLDGEYGLGQRLNSVTFGFRLDVSSIFTWP
ncbi:MAG TPA: Uma2 family endonuclease [Kofleriaceae bacterium]